MTENIRSLYRQSQLPVFQNRMYETREAARNCPKGDIHLVENLKSGLVYNAAFRSELVDYDSAYQNEQAVSERFREHLEAVAELVEKQMGRRGLVEVGCGKGFFLEMLLARGVDIVGFDPTYEGKNPRVRREYFGPELNMSGEGLILRHVLEHIPDPVAFLRGLANANGGRGLIYIEVPCFDWICDHHAWFDVFYEHVNYFRLSDFHRMFGRVLHADRAFGGQYLMVVADLSTLCEPQLDLADRPRFPEDFSARLASEVAAPVGGMVVWGGASKGVIFSLLRERHGHCVDAVIDINPAKQERFLPGTGLKVLAPETALAGLPEGATVYVMNPNYLEEIRSMSGNRFTYVGVGDE
tara:strand:+ start:2725 stop:3786 length:1062 start_codon:yes stop_codon:yes gene_type:complete